MPAAPISDASGGHRVKRLQKAIKDNLTHRRFPWYAEAIIVDGKPGPMTFKFAAFVASAMGFSRKQVRRIANGEITHYAELILTGQRKRTRAMKRRERERTHHFHKLREHHLHPPKKEGVVTFDGKPCAGWIAYWLQKARDHGWGGVLVSGFRTPEHSEQLCLAMCGAPTCPGRCAGRYTNHACPPTATCKEPEGAADVSEYTRFGEIMRQLGSPLHNSLGAADPVHFSAAGN